MLERINFPTSLFSFRHFIQIAVNKKARQNNFLRAFLLFYESNFE